MKAFFSLSSFFVLLCFTTSTYAMSFSKPVKNAVISAVKPPQTNVPPNSGDATTSKGLSLALSAAEENDLRRLAKESGSEVQKFRDAQVKIAKQRFNETPSPIEYFTAGLSSAIPADRDLLDKQSKARRDFTTMSALYWAWLFAEKDVCVTVDGKPKSRQDCLNRIKAFVLDWTGTYKFTFIQSGLRTSGNPISEAGLLPLILTYARVKNHLTLNSRESAQIKNWLANEYASLAAYNFSSSTTRSNFRSHQLLTLGAISVALNDSSKWQSVMETLNSHLDRNIGSDGSTVDFHDRDALNYHFYDLEPILKLACIAQKNHQQGIYFRKYASAPLPKVKAAVEFTIPYINGTILHPEFANSTNLPNDWLRHPRANPNSREHALDPLIFDSLKTDDSDYGNIKNRVNNFFNLAACLDAGIELDSRYSRLDPTSKVPVYFNSPKFNSDLVTGFNSVNSDRCDQAKAKAKVTREGALCKKVGDSFKWEPQTCPDGGIFSGGICCPASCGTCGGTGCGTRLGGSSCCKNEIKGMNRFCGTDGPPCQW